MKISKLFHTLYAFLMFLPVMVLPLFAININQKDVEPLNAQIEETQLVNFNQLAINGDFDEDRYLISASVDYTIEDNQCLVINSSGYSFSRLQYSAFTAVENHKYLAWVHAKNVSGNNRFGFNVYANGTGGDTLGDQYLNLTSQFQKVQFIFTSLNSNNNFFNFYPNVSDTVLGDSVLIRDFCIFDLTQMFGSGNEPTLQQFNTWYTNDYYDYTIGRKEILYIGNQITLNNTDIGSQFLYSLYNPLKDYFNLPNYMNLGGLYDWFLVNLFSGYNSPVYFIIFDLMIYWLAMSILWLIFDVLMYVPSMIHKMLDKARME